MVEINTITSNELLQLAALFAELSGKQTNIEKMSDSFSRMQNSGDYIVLGAKTAGQIVGSLMGIICHDLVGDCQPFMVIENVIVSNQWRRQGVGKQLMLEIEKIAVQRGCYYTMFVSGAHRQDAHRFYASLGYRLDQVQGFKKYLD